MKTYLKSNIEYVSKFNADDNESDSSDDNLPESVLADHTELSSDNSDGKFNKEDLNDCSNMVDDASIKSEPLSEEENNNSDLQRTSTLSKSNKRKSAEKMDVSSKLKPCTVEEYNEFLIVERKRNDLSLDMITRSDDNEEVSSPSKKGKKKKKKKSDILDTENYSNVEETLSINANELSPKKKKKHKKDKSSNSLEDITLDNTEIKSKNKKNKTKISEDTLNKNNVMVKNTSKNLSVDNNKKNSPNTSKLSSKEYDSEESIQDIKKNNSSIHKNNSFSNKNKRELQIAKLNNLSRNSSDESSDEELNLKNNSKHHTNTIKNNSNLNESKVVDSDSDYVATEKKYSFQFNRSYENNIESESESNQIDKSNKYLRKTIDDKNTSKEKLLSKNVILNKNNKKSDSSPSPVKSKKSNLLKNIVNSTVLDNSNIAETSFPNVSQILPTNTVNKTSFCDLGESIVDNQESDLIKKYCQENNLVKKQISKYIEFDDDNSDEEVYIVQCPKSINPVLLIDQSIHNSSFQFEGISYNLKTVENPTKNISLFIPGQQTIKSYPLVGNIVIQANVEPAPVKKVKNVASAPVEFPDTLKIRHPLFGKSYKKKIVVQPHVHEELSKKDKSKKHKKQKVKLEAAQDDSETPVKISKKRKLSSEFEEPVPKKKKKKHIKQEDLWNSNDDVERNLFNA
uniref:Putative cyclin-dependent serine/threonine-protein kinase n=1 Tax=Xenopsylla cheopis TaxID=163159 RepID=A0A6M2DJS2_XENCH